MTILLPCTKKSVKESDEVSDESTSDIMLCMTDVYGFLMKFIETNCLFDKVLRLNSCLT